jgi:hypothetical protein
VATMVKSFSGDKPILHVVGYSECVFEINHLLN